MKTPKRWILLLALLLVTAGGLLVLQRLGIRSLTILRNGVPAAGETIQHFGPEGIEERLLDERGTLQLPWALSESHPQFTFRAANDRNYMMKLPQRGARTYRVWDHSMATVDVLFELGPISWTREVVQEDG